MRFEYCNTLQNPYADFSGHMLYPLTEGKTVVLSPNKLRRFRFKKRKGAKIYPTVWLAPISLYGFAGRHVMLSVPDYGCTIIDPVAAKPTDLWLATKLPFDVCKVLAWHLKLVFLVNTGRKPRPGY
jgi:hypothetical protein